MTTLVVLQPGYLPWLGFFDQMIRADVFVYYDDVQYDKNGWRNRNRVKGPKGPVWLTVPILHKGRSDQLIRDVEITPRQPWAAKHVRTIKELYAQAPFAADHLPELEKILMGEHSHLADLCYELIEFFREALHITTPTVRSSELDIGGERSERLVNLCQNLSADTYLSGDAAQDYLETSLFDAAGIAVEWQKYKHPTYNQLHGDFISHLSIVDLVMNMGKESRRVLTGAS